MDCEEIKARAAMVEAAKKFGLDVFGEGAATRRSSSRFCLGVEHGDYNGTELLGVGTDRYIWLGFKANNRGEFRLYSCNFPDDGVVTVKVGSSKLAEGGMPPEKIDGWSHFVRGADWVLKEVAGFELTTGFDAVIYGNIPGGGLSRSASLCLNLLLTMLDVNGKKIDTESPKEMMQVVDWAQLIENKYTGSPCGILDQVMIAFARDGCATRFNPATRGISYVKYGGESDDFRLLVMDTGTTRHGLECSTYSIRARECKEMVELAKDKFGISCLADVKDKELLDKIVAEFKDSHPAHVKRLQYIYAAQQNFEAMYKAFEAGDIRKVGALFRADGIGLRDVYQISGPELEAMCDIVRTVPGVYGERMLGGGDKGASGCICAPESVPFVRAAVGCSYPAGHPDYASKYAVHECRFVQGITLLAPL